MIKQLVYKNSITVWLLVPVAGHNICHLNRPNVNVIQLYIYINIVRSNLAMHFILFNAIHTGIADKLQYSVEERRRDSNIASPRVHRMACVFHVTSSDAWFYNIQVQLKKTYRLRKHGHTSLHMVIYVHAYERISSSHLRSQIAYLASYIMRLESHKAGLRSHISNLRFPISHLRSQNQWYFSFGLY